MRLSPGTRLGPYEITAPLGAGGMGEVYTARDTRLNRIVAIKVSNEQFSERFEREAHAVAALNHSNVCTLHDVGPNYLVMEYIEGVPLKGPLPLHQALRYSFLRLLLRATISPERTTAIMLTRSLIAGHPMDFAPGPPMSRPHCR